MSSFDFNYLLRSPSGKIKLASAAVGLLAMAFCAGGHAHHVSYSVNVPLQEAWCKSGNRRGPGHLRSGREPEPGDSPKDDRGYFEKCLRFGFAEAGLAFVIIAWLFSVVIMIISAMPSLIEQPLYRKIDAFGHIGAGAVDILGFFLVIIYAYNIYANNFNKHTLCGYENLTDEDKSDCTKGYIWEATNRNGDSNGYRMIIWIFGALLALAHGIVCILIFMLVKKAQAQTGPMMVNQTGSQVPPTAYPSQQGSQQQAPPPEQQPSGHHSKHSHKV